MEQIEWFISLFKVWYTAFGRKYFDYIHNTETGQNFAFVNLALKIASQQVPYYKTIESAQTGGRPDGYLPENVPAFYFTERPVINYPGYVLNYSTSVGVVPQGSGVVKLNISGEDLFVPLNPAHFTINRFSFDQQQFATMAKAVWPVNEQLKNTVSALVEFHNKQINLLRNNNLTESQRNTITQKLNAAAEALLSLRNNAAYTVKITSTCQGTLPDNKQLQYFKNEVQAIVAVAWANYPVISAGKAATLTADLQQLENVTSKDFTPALTTKTPIVQEQKINWLYVFGGIGALYMLTNGKKQ